MKVLSFFKYTWQLLHKCLVRFAFWPHGSLFLPSCGWRGGRGTILGSFLDHVGIIFSSKNKNMKVIKQIFICILFLVRLCAPQQYTNNGKYIKCKKWIVGSYNIFFFWFLVFSSSWGLICCLSTRGDEVSMCHFKEIEFGLICFWWGWAKTVLKWIHNCFKHF